MKPRLLILTFIAALALGALAAACGDDGLSLQEYFQRVEAISDDAEERSDALEEEFEAAFDPVATEEEQIAATRDFFDAFATIFSDALDDVDDIDPPAEAEAAHNEFVEAFRTIEELFQDLADGITEVESLSELEQVFEEFDTPEANATFERFEDACLALEGIAAANGIVVDLDCAGEE